MRGRWGEEDEEVGEGNVGDEDGKMGGRGKVG